MNQFCNPVYTVQGAGCLNRLPEVLDNMKLKNGRVLVLAWSEKVLEYDVFLKLQQSKQPLDIHTVVFEASNPTVEHLFRVYQETKEFLPF